MKVHSIQTKLTGFTLAAILFAGGVPLFLSLNEHRALYKESVYANLVALSSNMSQELVVPLATEADPVELTTFLLKLEVYKNVKFARIYSKDRNVLAQYVREGEDFNGLNAMYSTEEVNQWALGIRAYNSDVVSLRVIGDAALPQGYLFMVHDYRRSLAASTQNLINSILPYLLLILCALMLVSLLSYRAVLQPLMKLSAFAKKVETSSDYSLRIQAKGKDEVSQLTHNISNMMDKIDAEINKNKEKTEKLLEQQKAMERLANYDSLTGLPNRQFFMELLRIELDRAIREQSDVSIMFIDLDNFKNVNDTLGHEAGDRLLVEISRRVKDCLRKGDILARLSGDEFLVLIPNHPENLVLLNIAHRIISDLEHPLQINEWSIPAKLSIGIANASQADFNLSAFISYADIAMYRSKMDGKGGCTFFDPKMLDDDKRQIEIANSILGALEANEFSIAYQPKVSRNAKVIGFEALSRWKSPQFGNITPAEFIAIAEKSGNISAISKWVIDRVFQDIPILKGLVGDHVVVSLNLSVFDINKPDFLDYIARKFKEHNIYPGSIEFEITESTYLDNFDRTNQFIESIVSLGSSIALDDFGTGYSSLSYLSQLKLNTLKIDKKFVDALGLSTPNTLVTKTIIDLARHLDLAICAEGVETREQADMLLDFGCDHLQGYYFGRPESLEQLQDKMA